VYLEEDCDASLFFDAKKERGIEVKIREKEVPYDGPGAIRNLYNYDPRYIREVLNKFPR
jgi:hypothetical protein